MQKTTSTPKDIVGLLIVGFLCLAGIIFSPANIDSAIVIGGAAILYIFSPKPSTSTRHDSSARLRFLASVSLIFGISSLLCSPFSISPALATVSIIFGCIVASQSSFGSLSSINPVAATAYVSIVLSFLAFISIAIFVSVTSWPLDLKAMTDFFMPR